MSSKRLILFTVPVLVLLAAYLLGPKPATPILSLAMPVVPDDAEALEQLVKANDASHKIKPGNEGEIVWKDSARQKTEYAVVYLHGFSASKVEGDPIHRQFARTFGCNLYMPRLADHGIDTTEALQLFTADRLWESAKQALAIGKKLGNKVILISTSTGGTLALKLAAEYPADVHAMINMSPNIKLRNGASFLLNNHWGLYIARAVFGGNYNITDASPEHAKYWNSKYRLEALPQLEELLEDTMIPETFKRVTQPTLTLYYYKNEEEQDAQVSVSAMLKMNEVLGTPPAQKKTVNFPDAGAHVIGSSLTNSHYEEVYEAIRKFAEDVLTMKPVTM